MNINDMTLGQIKEVAALAKSLDEGCAPQVAEAADSIPVLVWTAHRGVIFGYTNAPHARPITLTGARMCLYWSQDVGGVFGLAENGPTSGCRISATIESADFEDITGVARVAQKAEKAWLAAEVQGRD